ncbi:MAG TPA: DinB family protein [Longimicrobiales bacterium]|nr:DinB family protein [Longimicrobiales bacterium]
MNPQLQRIETEFRDARARLHRLREAVPRESWPVRPAPDRWSIADCVEHLNRTSEAFLPLLHSALSAASGAARQPERRYRRDPLGFMLSVIMPPPVRLVRTKTSRPFEPTAVAPAAELVERFDLLQEEQLRCLRDADGLPLNEISIRSPFDARARYNAYSCFVILPRHQHRHLWQAEQVARALRVPGSS